MNVLERAITIAVEAHRGQVDKAEKPYILHPLRVMFRLETDEERQAAVLHDLIEDCGWTLEQLFREGFSPEVVSAVDALTRREGEDYFDFIRRAAAHPLAWAVKRADLLDNMDLTRIANPTENDTRRLEKYRRALSLLEEEVILKVLGENNPSQVSTLIKSASTIPGSQKEIMELLISCKDRGMKRRNKLSYTPPLYGAGLTTTGVIEAKLPECSIPKCDGKVLFSGYYYKLQPENWNRYLFVCSTCLTCRGEWLWSSGSTGWDQLENNPAAIDHEPLLERIRELTIG